ncbi:hypothetical protein V3528_19830, partial [Acinetobacter johnsonii]|uniref:hypothetical protein n=1 Tax=Acinetobacter johnsonii TaxID=40214 RepID=UPI0030FB8072
MNTDLYDSEIETSSILYFNFSNLKIIDGLNFNFIYQSYHNEFDDSPREDRKFFDIRATKGLTRN